MTTIYKFKYYRIHPSDPSRDSVHYAHYEGANADIAKMKAFHEINQFNTDDISFKYVLVEEFMNKWQYGE